MLSLSQSAPRVTRNRIINSSVTTIEEGQGLTVTRVAGEVTVKVGASANTDEFAGVALYERTAPSLFPSVYKARVTLISAGLWGVLLPRNVVGSVRVIYTSNGTALTLDVGGSFDAGEYKITNSNIIEVNSADLGKELQITYTYAPTTSDLMQIGGDNSPTTFAPLPTEIGVTGVVEEGVVYTSNFDPTADWANWTPATAIKVGTNGIFQLGGTGATVKGRVISAPNVDQPFLGIDFSVL